MQGAHKNSSLPLAYKVILHQLCIPLSSSFSLMLQTEWLKHQCQCASSNWMLLNIYIGTPTCIMSNSSAINYNRNIKLRELQLIVIGLIKAWYVGLFVCPFGGFDLMETLIMLLPLILVQRLSIHDADAVNLKWQKEWDKTRGNWLRCKCNSSSFKTCTVYTKQILSKVKYLLLHLLNPPSLSASRIFDKSSPRKHGDWKAKENSKKEF